MILFVNGVPLGSERLNQQVTVFSVHVNGFNENYYPLTIQIHYM